MTTEPAVTELRLVVTAPDYDEALRFCPQHAAYIDEVEVGRRLAGHAGPTPTPWRSLNARLKAPGDLQLTLFGELPRLTGAGGRW